MIGNGKKRKSKKPVVLEKKPAKKNVVKKAPVKKKPAKKKAKSGY